ncbi:DUF6000 family protein [Nonomuraea sp. LP-02]|uniref:DUF6000 family protein n=1 Tax=Nonomuraea sp. LP-02 TaxID=3097960 RepID=UPI002E362454|nr:DUF6000 family protein [Nonomuraea sp. LP-02]MED7926249.1 DUF6000 family protein [Nonomuraea sp. LP-02]
MMRLPVSPDVRQRLMVRRYVATGRGSVRRYLRLLGGFVLLMSDRQVRRFGRALARDARRVADDDLETLLGMDWRCRLVAAWMIGLDRRTRFRERLSGLLLESECPYAGQGYCLALACFGEERDAEIITAYLDRWLPEESCDYDQDDAMGVLLYLDESHATDRAARFLAPGGLWENSAMAGKDPVAARAYIELLHEFAVCSTSGQLKHWLPLRRRFLDDCGGDQPMYGDEDPDR